MSRDLSFLNLEKFDLAVIGAGIIGSAAAYEAARRGLRVVLLDKGDFGHATSSGCFKTVHGGLRYLQSVDLPRIFESAAEQRALRRLAPHLVRPLPFLVPCSGFGLRSRRALDLAAAVYETLAWRRNAGVVPEAKLSPHRLVSAAELRRIAPDLELKKTSGGIIFYDALMHSPERLTWSFAAGAAACGARTANYVRVAGFDLTQNEQEAPRRKTNIQPQITALRAVDELSGAEFKIEAACVINAAGPWIKSIERLTMPPPVAARRPEAPKFSKGIQVIVPKLIDSCALAVESRFAGDGAVVARGNRSYFIIPWRSWSLIGTADALHTGNPDTYELLEDEVRGLVEDVRRVFRSPGLTLGSVRHAFGGLRPIDPRFRGKFEKLDYFSGTVEPSHDDTIVDHGDRKGGGSADLPQNLISVEGIKYSTARAVAERAVAIACRKIGRPWTTPPEERLPGGQFKTIAALVEDATRLLGEYVPDPLIIDHLVAQYGSSVTEIAALIRERPALGRPLGDSGTLGAEIVFSARAESVVHLSDLLLRRTAAATAGYPGEKEARAAADLAGRELGWDRARIDAECEQLRAEFPVERFSFKHAGR